VVDSGERASLQGCATVAAPKRLDSCWHFARCADAALQHHVQEDEDCTGIQTVVGLWPVFNIGPVVAGLWPVFNIVFRSLVGSRPPDPPGWGVAVPQTRRGGFGGRQPPNPGGSGGREHPRDLKTIHILFRGQRLFVGLGVLVHTRTTARTLDCSSLSSVGFLEKQRQNLRAQYRLFGPRGSPSVRQWAITYKSADPSGVARCAATPSLYVGGKCGHRRPPIREMVACRTPVG
jgi:hypothetical protein